MYLKYRAQSLPEVAIILTLVGVTAVTVLMLFGKNIGDMFNATKVNTDAPQISSASAISASSALEVVNMPPPPPPGMPMTGMGPPPPPGSIPISLSQSSFTANVTNAMETAGANGATSVMLQDLALQAQYYLSKGEISQEEYTNVMALVQSGSRIAAAEKAIEDAMAKSNNDSSILANTPVVFEGKTYKIADLLNIFDYRPGYYDMSGELFKTFDAQKKSILGNVANAEAKSKMNILSDQILTVANAFAGAVFASVVQGAVLQTNDIIPNAAKSDSMNELNNNGVVSTSWDTPLPDPPSVTTTNNSTAICTTGKTTVGTTCK